MSAAIKVYGARDDLVEVDGAINEEFSAEPEDGVLAFSNGVLLRIRYDTDGVWRITPITGAEKVSIDQAPVDDEDRYSDVATITDPVTWVTYGTEYARKKD